MLTSTTRTMWRAWLIAPAVAPISFACGIVLLGAIAPYFDIAVNPAAIVVMPAAAVVMGLPTAYVVSGAIGMPIAFVLKRLKALNFVTIHATACGLAIGWAGVSRFTVTGDGVPVGYALDWFFYSLGMTGPPILFSAFVFWLLLWRQSGIAVKDNQSE